MKTYTYNTKNVRGEFFSPVAVALQQSPNTRNCHGFSDIQYLESGVGRVLNFCASGRDWVQRMIMKMGINVSVSNFFAALKSERRQSVVKDVAEHVCKQADMLISEYSDPLAIHPELDNFEVYASDGHTHKCSAHEKPIMGKKYPVTQIFSLNLRTHTLTSLALSTPQAHKKKEHEISTLKRITTKELRMNQPTGKKVLHVYDPAIIDYTQWHKWKRGSGIYIITREKQSSTLIKLGDNQWDKSDSRNIGIIADEIVGPSNGTIMRRIMYYDPVAGKMYRYITNEMTLPPGLLAFLYKLRWDVEKVFDEIKNKTFEQKAWAKSHSAKRQQSMFIALAHNLMRILETKLEKEENIVDETSTKKRKERIARDICKAEKAGYTPNPLVSQWRRATQRSAQFIRWLTHSLNNATSWQEAIRVLRPLMVKIL